MIEILFLDIINENSDIRKFDISRLQNGIQLFVEDHGLEVFEDITSDEEVLKNMLREYLRPITHDNEYSLCDYFVNYEKLRMLKLLSKTAFQLAVAKYERKTISGDKAEEIKKQVESIVWELYMVPALKKYVERLYSETVLDIQYSMGKSSNISKRLLDYIK